MRKRVVVAFAVLFCIVCMPVRFVHAQTFGFYNITNNDPVDAAVGEAQLSVEVTNGGNEVLFIFMNEGPNPCSITDVYFDDGTLLDLVGLIDLDDDYVTNFDLEPHLGVDFSPGASPPDLPGGELINPPFQVSIGFAADSDPPPPSWGVEPSEYLGVVFSLKNSGTLDQVVQELRDEVLRIGLHVQAFDNGGIDSESFVNVPEPATIALLGLGGLVLLRRRRK